MNNPAATKETLKQKAVTEVRHLLVTFVYLALFFLVIKLYTKLILSEYHINYLDYGLTVVKALVLAKIILTADALRLGERFREQLSRRLSWEYPAVSDDRYGDGGPVL